MANREDLRNKIFSNARPKSIEVEFFGVMIELRQPPMRQVLELQQLEDRSSAAAQMIVGYAYVPGTDERMFDVADVEQIALMPFGADLARVNQAITELTDINFQTKEAEGNSETTA